MAHNLYNFFLLIYAKRHHLPWLPHNLPSGSQDGVKIVYPSLFIEVILPDCMQCKSQFPTGRQMP